MRAATKVGLTTRPRLRMLAAGVGAIAFGLTSLLAVDGDITYGGITYGGITFSTFFTWTKPCDPTFPTCDPVGIDFNEDGELIASAGFPGPPSAEIPSLARIPVRGDAQSQFSTLTGLGEELKVATVRTSPGCQAFPVGDVFTGTGRPGEIVRIRQDEFIYRPADFNSGRDLPAPNLGATSWVQLPGESRLLRGSFYVDRSCEFGGDLIVITGGAFQNEGGRVWRVDPDGRTIGPNGEPGTVPLASIGTGTDTHLEGVLILPNDPKYGPWAGKIIVGAEGNNLDLREIGKIYSISAGGEVDGWDLSFRDAGGVLHPMKPEDLDWIEAGQDFFGINFSNKRLLRAPKADFAPFVDDVLFTQETPCGSALATADCLNNPRLARTTGLYAIRWVGEEGTIPRGGYRAGRPFGSDATGVFSITPFTFSPTLPSDSSLRNIDQWEHVTLACIPEPNNLTFASTTTVFACPNPNLIMRKVAKRHAIASGTVARFTIVVTNQGPGLATGVTLRDLLPLGLTWSHNQPDRCAIVGGQLNCTIGELAEGASFTIRISAPTSTTAVIGRASFQRTTTTRCRFITNNATVEGANEDPRQLADNSSTDSIAVDCPGQPGGPWSWAHPFKSTAVARADLDGNGIDDLVMDMGPGAGVGVWMNYSTWVQLHPFNASRIVAGDLDGNGQDEVVLNFPGFGVWSWENNSAWRHLHPSDAGLIAVGRVTSDAGKQLVVGFTGKGVWIFSGQRWVPLHDRDASLLLVAQVNPNPVVVTHPLAEVVIGFVGAGLWEYNSVRGWRMIHPFDVRRVAAGDLDGQGSADLVIDFGPQFGLWSFLNGGNFFPLHPFSAVDVVVANIDGLASDEIVVDFGPPHGVWAYQSNTGWRHPPDWRVGGLITGVVN